MIVAILLAASIVIFLAIALLPVPLSIATNRWHNPPILMVAIGVRIALLVTSALLLQRLRHYLVAMWDANNLDLSPGRPEPEQVGADRATQYQSILDSIRRVEEKYSPEAIGLFCRMLTDFNHRARATERAELLGNSLRIRTSINHVISGADRLAMEESAYFPIPLLTLTKGTLLDNFEVSDSGNGSMATLPQHETRGLIAVALEVLFALTFEPGTITAPPGSETATQAQKGTDVVPKRTPEMQAALWALRGLVCRIGRIALSQPPPGQTGTDDIDEVARVFYDAVKDLRPVNVRRLLDLRDFCRFFARNYVIAVEVPVPNGVRFVIKYQKDMPVYGRTGDQDRRRTAIGLNPYKIVLPLNLAFTASSYHFRMDNGENQFVAHHYIQDRHSGNHVTQDQIRMVVPNGYVRVRHNSALPYAHLYIRGLHRAGPQDWMTVVLFEETPPGALGATLVVAAVSAALILPLTFISAVNASSSPNGADTSALLLAVPLFAATLVGHSIERVQRSSLITYVGLVCTGVIALLAAILFGLMPNDWLVIKNAQILGILTVPGLNLGGLTLSMVAIANVTILYWMLRYRTERYVAMLKRWEKLDSMFK